MTHADICLLDARRKRFLDTLYGMSDAGRTHLLRIESDQEIEDLKRVALEWQYFEMAACMVQEMKRRQREDAAT